MAMINVKEVLNDYVLHNPLPNGLELFDPIGDGTTVFAIRGASGGIAANLVSYLIKRGIGSSAMCVPFYVDSEEIERSLNKAVYSFSSKATEVNLNGGDLGLPE